MKALTEFVKTTLVGGLLFLAPLVLVVLLLGQAVKMIETALGPVVHLLPVTSVAGVAGATIAAALGLVALCFLAGLFARTRMARVVSGPLERVVLRRVPGYTFVKSVTGTFAGLEGAGEVSVALARIEDAWVLSFVLERHASGLSTVFVPSAPTPVAGSVYYLTEDRLRPLDVSVAAAIACMTRLGIGSRELLERASVLPGNGG
jgi:uncharacterized membrane protein